MGAGPGTEQMARLSVANSVSHNSKEGREAKQVWLVYACATWHAPSYQRARTFAVRGRSHAQRGSNISLPFCLHRRLFQRANLLNRALRRRTRAWRRSTRGGRFTLGFCRWTGGERSRLSSSQRPCPSRAATLAVISRAAFPAHSPGASKARAEHSLRPGGVLVAGLGGG